MTQTLTDWIRLTGESGPHWHHLTKGISIPIEGAGNQRPPVRAVYAIASKDLISHPHWVSSKDRDIISQVVRAENEKIGVRTDSGPGKISDWKPIQLNGTRTLVQSVAIPWEFDQSSIKTTEFTDFVPQYSLFSPPEDSIVLWRENAEWVAGYSRGNTWAHIQPLGNLASSDVSSEVQLTMMELTAKDIIISPAKVVVWGTYDASLHETIETQTGLNVTFEALPPPSAKFCQGWKFEPHEVSEKKLKKARERKNVGIGLLTFFLLLLLASSAFFHLWTLQRSNNRLATKIEQGRPSADRVREVKAKWETLSPAIEPRRSPVEVFYQISRLLPAKGVRITSFELRNFRDITVTGEVSVMGSGLKLSADLQNSPELSDFEWSDFQPRQKGDVFEFTATGKYRFAE